MESRIKEVPKEERLEVYKKALTIVANFDGQFKLPEPELCVILPLIQNKLSYYKQYNGLYMDTSKRFPELKSFLTKGFLGEYSNEERIEFLTKTIKQLES